MVSHPTLQKTNNEAGVEQEREIYQTTATFQVNTANQTTVTDPLNLPKEDRALF